MRKVIEVVFDGTSFVPSEPVSLPAGTRAAVEVPDPAPRAMSVGAPPPPPTEEDKREWEELLEKIRAAPLPWATVDEAVAAQRSSSWRPELPEEVGPPTPEGGS